VRGGVKHAGAMASALQKLQYLSLVSKITTGTCCRVQGRRWPALIRFLGAARRGRTCGGTRDGLESAEIDRACACGRTWVTTHLEAPGAAGRSGAIEMAAGARSQAVWTVGVCLVCANIAAARTAECFAGVQRERGMLGSSRMVGPEPPWAPKAAHLSILSAPRIIRRGVGGKPGPFSTHAPRDV
jgi:hypothetical protein